MSGSAWTGAAIAAVTAGYALFSRRLATTAVSAPMVFTGFGVAIGPVGLGLLELEHEAGPVLTLVEAALTIVLVTDAMSVRRRDLRVGGFLPRRLLGIGLPLTIGAGWLLAWPLLPGLTAWELALVGAILAPTDAALGKTTVSSPRVPSLVRGGLNVESGLNDGMVLPFFVLFLAALPDTAASEEGIAGAFWRALVLSTVLGLAVGRIGGWLLRWSRGRGLATRGWQQVFVLAVAAGSYTLAVVVDGSGFIAAWVAGFAFGVSLRQGEAADAPPVDEDTAGLAEHLAELLASLSFLVFGAVLLGPALEHLDWRIITYAVLSLTVVRMLPVALSLAGSGLALPTVAYIGWFGPRGLASIVFGLLVVEEHVPGVRIIGEVVAVTVALSIVLHGVSAVVLTERYGDWHKKAAARRPQLREGMPDEKDAGSASTTR
ncbi:cation:proton antiporter [Streptomyces sp. NBC_01381]|uniref:cation:proton antiporter n=1 Tax=Streptomyces sp. NBC_01381 TaxID=2903845 RepID=UPI002253BD1B|nr:cation:proton antiporter [Streptomyces sp. NBC_01381]MCX4665459.1 cation:proton antiporter [Streptomyces sp. NBC_01381]